MKKRILVVEDEKDLAETIKLNLEIEDYHPIVVYDGLDAINAFKEQSFDLVILDIMIPSVNGIEVCEITKLFNLIKFLRRLFICEPSISIFEKHFRTDFGNLSPVLIHS